MNKPPIFDDLNKLWLVREGYIKKIKSEKQEIKKIKKRRKIRKEIIIGLNLEIAKIMKVYKIRNFYEKLPNEIIIEICMFMKIPDIFNLAITCKNLLQLIFENEILWKNIAYRYVIKNKEVKNIRNTELFNENYWLFTLDEIKKESELLDESWLKMLYKNKRNKKKSGVWRTVVWHIHNIYCNPHKKRVSKFSLFKEHNIYKLRNNDNFKKINNKGKKVLNMEKVNLKISEDWKKYKGIEYDSMLEKFIKLRDKKKLKIDTKKVLEDIHFANNETYILNGYFDKKRLFY
jgi:hypothetical protein